MPTYDKDKMDKIEAAMFGTGGKTQKLTPAEEELKNEVQMVFSIWLNFPTKTDSEMKHFLKFEHGMDSQKSYRVMWMAKYLLGNVKNASKEWYRYMVLQSLQEQYNKADASGKQAAAIDALMGIIKATKLDKDDDEEFGYDKVFIPEWEITGDITVLGLPQIPDLTQRIQKMRAKYMDEIEDVDHEEISGKE